MGRAKLTSLDLKGAFKAQIEGVQVPRGFDKSQLQVVDPKDVHVDADRHDRQNTLKKGWPEFVRSIREYAAKNGAGVGNHEPVILRGGPGKLRLVTGRRRREACIEAKVKLLAIIDHGMNDELAEEIMLTENTARNNYSPYELILLAVDLRTKGREKEHIARLLGKTKRMIEIYNQLATKKHLMDGLKNETLTVTDALNALREEKALDAIGDLAQSLTFSGSDGAAPSKKKKSGKPDTQRFGKPERQFLHRLNLTKATLEDLDKANRYLSAWRAAVFARIQNLKKSKNA